MNRTALRRLWSCLFILFPAAFGVRLWHRMADYADWIGSPRILPREVENAVGPPCLAITLVVVTFVLTMFLNQMLWEAQRPRSRPRQVASESRLPAGAEVQVARPGPFAIPLWLIISTSLFMVALLSSFAVLDLDHGVWAFIGGCGVLLLATLAFSLHSTFRKG